MKRGGILEPGRKRLLLIESDPTISDLLSCNLRRVGYDVLVAHSGLEGLELGLEQEHDLALVDLVLPGLDGMSVGQAIAEFRPGTPFVVMASQSEPAAIIQAFNGGADDFVTKPLDFDLLHARIRASLARHRPHSDEAQATRATISFNAAVLDRDARTLRARAGEVALNRKEYALLELFFSEPGRLLLKADIVERVWHHRYLPESRTLDAHISRIRGKLRAVDADVSVQSVRRIGYRLAELERRRG